MRRSERNTVFVNQTATVKKRQKTERTDYTVIGLQALHERTYVSPYHKFTLTMAT